MMMMTTTTMSAIRRSTPFHCSKVLFTLLETTSQSTWKLIQKEDLKAVPFGNWLLPRQVLKKMKKLAVFLYKSCVCVFFFFRSLKFASLNSTQFSPEFHHERSRERSKDAMLWRRFCPRFFDGEVVESCQVEDLPNFSALVTDDPNKTMRCISLCIPFQCGKIDLEMIYFNCHLHILQCCGKELGFLSGSGFPGRVCIWSTGQNMWRMPGVVLCPTQIFCRRLVPKNFRLNPKDWRFERLRETFSQRLEL